MGHSLPGLLIMFDMWFCNSVTFVFSQSFVIIGLFIVYCVGLNVLLAIFGQDFFSVKSTGDFDILTTINLVLYAVATHCMLYNINHFVKLTLLKTRRE
jgi:hypothetical protein